MNTAEDICEAEDSMLSGYDGRIPVLPRLCFNWLPQYRYAFIAYQSLLQSCASRVIRKGDHIEYSHASCTNVNDLPPAHCVELMLMDPMLQVDGWQGYLARGFENQLEKFSDGRCFFPLTKDLALIVAKESGTEQLLNAVIPYTTPAPPTLTASLAVAGAYAGVRESEILEAHKERKIAGDILRQELAGRYKLNNSDTLYLHSAAVGGIIEGVTRYLHTNRPGFTSCVLAPEYWDLLRYLLTYSPKGIRLVPGRDGEIFPKDKWLSELSKKDLDLAYLSFTSNPVGDNISEDVLIGALEAVSDNTLFFIDCTSVDIEERSSIEKLAPLIKKYAHKNILIAKSFSKEYDVGHLRIGYAIFTRVETAKTIWPFMATYPPAEISRAALRLLRGGNRAVLGRYATANKMLLEKAPRYKEIRVTGGFSNYSIVFFESDEAAAKMRERLAESFGHKIYPGEIPMQGGGDIGLGQGEIDLASMKRIPFLAPNALRLVVTPESVKAFFEVIRS